MVVWILRRPFAGLVAAAALAMPGAAVRAQMGVADPNPECQLTVEARLPMTENSGHYMVSASIGGHSDLMIVDTGANVTALTPEAADAMGLEVDGSQTELIAGVGSSEYAQYPRIVPSFSLGPLQWTNMKVLTAHMLTPKMLEMHPAPIGMIGTDVLSRYDVEFDFPAKLMTLYSAQNCLGRFAPWRGRYYAYSPEYTKLHDLILPLMLNGHPVRALLDTGASRTMVPRETALESGVSEADLDRARASSGTGFKGAVFTTHTYAFDSLQVGPVTYRHVPLTVSDAPLMSTGMLLGMDFMRSRRVWVSYSTGWVFMQPAMSTVAAPPSGRIEAGNGNGGRPGGLADVRPAATADGVPDAAGDASGDDASPGTSGGIDAGQPAPGQTSP
ncbi:retropepsin-like aspartic protease [Burkholderia sp. WAC0059]|uniref:retropepsin-like aspartic protease n=1 Tax=Burkholderia sp. WAC0059 TaxID=2066022 RepID=UPI0015E156BE|nr:retropepsin-like aspartic protease [Burkholderia sp. WAC0059]